jgi:hypothetical protein
MLYSICIYKGQIMLRQVLNFLGNAIRFVWNLILNILRFFWNLLNRFFAFLGTLRWSRMKRSGKNTFKFISNPVVQLLTIAIAVFVQSVTTITFVNYVLSWVIVIATFMLVTQNLKGLFRFLYK